MCRRRRKIVGKSSKNMVVSMGKSWENMGKSLEHLGKSWENWGKHGKILGKPWKILGTLGKIQYKLDVSSLEINK